jgi:hypothetical protein
MNPLVGIARMRSTLVGELKRLQPQEFENLAYDLLFVSGLQNLRWRTPSADGGRDLEGELPTVDFAGEHAVQRWYVECKRYAKSINWPTVYEKVAVAANHDADFLLFVTTANFSAPCRDEVQKHNSKPHNVQIRLWPFYRLENLLAVHGQIAIKYGLVQKPEALHFDFEKVVLELTKLAQSTYAAAAFGSAVQDRLEILAAFTELLSTRIDDVKRFGRFVTRPFKPSRDSYDWCTPYPLEASNFDQTSLRALLACIRAILKVPALNCSITDGEISVSGNSVSDLIQSPLLMLVSTFGLIDAELVGERLVLKSR